MGKIRFSYIDIAKAIAILLMVLLHSNYTYRGFNSSVGAFHMAVFFFVAGMFAKGPSTPFKTIAVKSFNQLIVPYFIFSFIALFYGWVYPHLHPVDYHTSGDFGDIMKKAVIGIFLMRDRVTDLAFHPCAALWFLSSLFWCRIFFSLWIKSSLKDFYLIRIAIIGFLYWCYSAKISYFAMNSTAISIPYFILGYYLNNWLTKCYGNIRVIWAIFLAIFALAMIYFLPEHSVMPDDAEINGNIFLAYLKGLLGISGVILAAIVLDKARWRQLAKPFVYVGTATLTILGLHIPFILAFKVIYVLSGGIKESIPMSLALPVSILTCLICAFIHHEFLKKKFPWIIGKSYFFSGDK